MYERKIEYDRELRDYGMYIKYSEEWELVGFARTYQEGEVTLDQLVFELISGQHYVRTGEMPTKGA